MTVERGRGFTESDDATSLPGGRDQPGHGGPLLAREDPVGARIQVSGADGWMQMVGVVSDVRNLADTRRARRTSTVPFAQDARQGMYLVARTATLAGTVAGPAARGHPRRGRGPARRRYTQHAIAPSTRHGCEHLPC